MTVEEANNTRKGLVGNAAFLAWKQFKETTPGEREKDNASSLREWDEQHNFSALRATFGSDEDLLDFGITQKYRMLVSNWFQVYYRPSDGAPRVSLQAERVIGGNRVLLENMKDSDREYLVESQKGVIKRAAIRLHLYEKDWGKVRNLIDGWLFDLEKEGTTIR